MTNQAEQVAAHDAAAQQAEDAAVAAAVDGLVSAVRGVNRWLVGVWGRTFGRPTTAAEGKQLDDLLEELAFRITGIALDPADSMLAHARRARLLGVDQGFVEVGAPVRQLAGDVLDSTVVAVERAVKTARGALADAAAAVRALPSGDLAAVQQRAAGTAKATLILERTTRTTFNAELNQGVTDAAREVGAQLVWVAERDACVVCLALSGDVVEPGGVFDWRKTFGAKAYEPRAYNADGELVTVGLERPPRHPNCRCRLSPWLGHDAAAAMAVTHDWKVAEAEAILYGDHVAAQAARDAAAAAGRSAGFDFPASLRREAERSILLGHALPSESETVRTQAADRLLQKIGSATGSRSPSGWAVPATVKRKTRAALKRGTFTTGPVPTGRK